MAAKKPSVAGMNTAQKEAFTWYLSQKPGERRAIDITDNFGVSKHQAEAWLTEFNKILGKRLEPRISTTLKSYVQEFEVVQQQAIEGGQIASEIYLDTLREIQKNPDDDQQKRLSEAVKGLKSVYDMVEKASCADVAKATAKQSDASSALSGPSEASYNMSDFANALGISGEFTENDSDIPPIPDHTDTSQDIPTE